MPTADMTLVKILLNSVISTKGAKCVMFDVKDFYLNTPMTRYEYTRLKLTDIPEEIIVEYKLHEILTSDGYVYIEIRKGMYGLPQAGIIAQQLLEQHPATVGYYQSKIVPGLWTHKTRDICFTLVVDDFAVKYTKKEDAQHLIDAIQKNYTITIDWDATKYIGLTVHWDYTNHKVYLHMPGYLTKALQRFKHEIPKSKQNSPHPLIAPLYGIKQQTRKNPILPPTWRGSSEICPGGSRHTFILCEGSRQYHPHSSQRDRNRTGEPDGEHVGKGQTIVRLLCNARRCGH
jgi:hypothetical protein